MSAFIYRFVDPTNIPEGAEPEKDPTVIDVMTRFFRAELWAVSNPAPFEVFTAMLPSIMEPRMRVELFERSQQLLRAMSEDVADNGPTAERTLLCRVPPPQELMEAAEDLSFGLAPPRKEN